MDKDCFNNILDHAGYFTPEEWESLRNASNRYPFCAPLRVLSLMADKAHKVPLWEKQMLPLVSLYMVDVDLLHQRLNQVSDAILSPVVAKQEAEAKEAQRKEVESEEPFDIFKEINSYQEVSFKTAPKSVILSNFLEKDAGIHIEDSGFDPVPVEDLGKKSVARGELLITETLALVLEKQGRLAKAVEVYEKLMVSIPEKSSIFAVRIDELKRKLAE